MKVIQVLFALLVVLNTTAGEFFPFSDPNFAFIGRYAKYTDHIAFAWSGFTIETQLSGVTNLSVFIAGESSGVYFDVLVNGQNITVLQTGVKANLTIFYDFPKTFVLTLVRRTEVFTGVSSFFGLNLNSGAIVSAAPRPSRKIEFIGDSITCGYGNDGIYPCHFTPATENARLSHGYLTAKLLNADVMITAWSGIGLVHNGGDKANISANPLPAFYNQTIGQRAYVGYWNFLSWVPQAVVINLGTNDFNTVWQFHVIFQTAYLEFIGKIRDNYRSPALKIFIACGPMSHYYCNDLVVVANKTTHVYVIPALPYLPPSDIGCDGHPNAAGDAAMAKLQANAIANVMGW